MRVTGSSPRAAALEIERMLMQPHLDLGPQSAAVWRRRRRGANRRAGSLPSKKGRIRGARRQRRARRAAARAARCACKPTASRRTPARIRPRADCCSSRSAAAGRPGCRCTLSRPAKKCTGVASQYLARSRRGAGAHPSARGHGARPASSARSGRAASRARQAIRASRSRAASRGAREQQSRALAGAASAAPACRRARPTKKSLQNKHQLGHAGVSYRSCGWYSTPIRASIWCAATMPARSSSASS